MLSEASALLCSSSFWLLMDANPSEPGSPMIPASQTLKTLAIMLAGELVVTDSAVAYASNKFKKRYIVDVAAAWNDIWTKRRLLWSFVATMTLTATCITTKLPLNMRYTSRADDEPNLALTSCPTPPTNVTQITRVKSAQGTRVFRRNTINSNKEVE